MPIRCLIVDDEPLAVNLLEGYIAQVPFLTLSGKCYNAMEALSFLHRHEVDLVFLDINMPKLSGLEIAGSLASQLIIFTTAYSQHAVESYEKNAVDYLLKPITFDRFVRAANKAYNLYKRGGAEASFPVSKPEPVFYIKSGKSMVKVNLDEVLFIEGLKDYVTFHTLQQKHVAYKRMKELEDVLPANFSRVHNSFIVNRDHIDKIEQSQVFIQGQPIPVSDKYREVFFREVSGRLL
ncbi:MAG TPA: LytTR family DNA-binding domain-containing protein [Chitinophagaceae bacterium]|nr:LytTR family DNA-binding domain-containing protein [Chitinophagaceae bacterium]